MPYHRTTAMTAASRRNGTRQIRALQLGTALATTLFVSGFGTPAFGQALPVVNSAGGATIVTNPTDLQINLNDGNRVIDFNSYNVNAGNTVNYLTTDTTSQYAVLNRVTVIAPGNNSVINGAVTTAANSNIVVWLSNPNGILVGPTGSFNTGGLVLTTMGTDPVAFLASGGGAEGGAFTLTGGSGSIAIGGTLTTTAGGGLVGTLLLAAPRITVTGSATASGTAALVAASDATFSAGIGSPLAVTITAGTAVTGIDISDSGGTATPAISGASVALVGASATTVMGALLNVDAGASLTATGTNGSILIATKDAGTVALTENADAVTVQGSLTTQAGGSVSIQAAGTATVGSAVNAGTGGYSVSGSDVTWRKFQAMPVARTSRIRPFNSGLARNTVHRTGESQPTPAATSSRNTTIRTK